MTKLLVVVLIAAFAAFAWWSLPPPDQAQTGGTAPAIANGKGVVQRIDKGRGGVTIKHGALPELKMMPMTMSFPVKAPSQLANLQPMQEVEFQVSYDGG